MSTAERVSPPEVRMIYISVSSCNHLVRPEGVERATLVCDAPMLISFEQFVTTLYPESVPSFETEAPKVKFWTSRWQT